MKAVPPKLGVVALLVGAAALGYSQSGAAFSPLLLSFAVLNALISPRGTGVVRGLTVAVSSVALALPDMSRSLLPFIWLLWPPAFLIAWSTGRPAGQSDAADSLSRRRARIGGAALIGAVGAGAILYEVISAHRMEQTSALFIGIPTLLAIAVVFAVSPRSAAGVACKAVTIALLLSLVFLGEGVVCILMSAPIFYGVAVVFAVLIEKISERHGHKAYSLAVLLLFAPMSLEGVTDWTTLSRDEWVTETRIVHASSDQVEAALWQTPRFERVLPTYLRIGFPRPTSTRIEAEDRVRWVVRFRGGEMRLDGIEPRAGDLVLELVDRRPGQLHWQAVSDDSHMTHFLNWRESTVQWTPIDAHSTRVTWTLRYRRGLDPAWYFGPWERYATKLAAGYLIESVATP
jgi:hypothetical protein